MFPRLVSHPLTRPTIEKFTPDQTLVGLPVSGATDVLTISEVKNFLPVRVDTQDPLIEKTIKAVTRQVEGYIRRDVVKKSIQSFWFSVPQIALLPRGPHGDIIKVEAIDQDNNVTELSEGVDYRVEGLTFKRLVSINASGALAVTFESGYETDKIPPEIPQAILQEISLQYKNRSDPDTPGMTVVGNLSLEARNLLSALIRRAL